MKKKKQTPQTFEEAKAYLDSILQKSKEREEERKKNPTAPDNRGFWEKAKELKAQMK